VEGSGGDHGHVLGRHRSGGRRLRRCPLGPALGPPARPSERASHRLDSPSLWHLGPYEGRVPVLRQSARHCGRDPGAPSPADRAADGGVPRHAGGPEYDGLQFDAPPPHARPRPDWPSRLVGLLSALVPGRQSRGIHRNRRRPITVAASSSVNGWPTMNRRPARHRLPERHGNSPRYRSAR